MSTNHRMTRRDWIEAAYAALARDGERGITINGLAARLGVTKGSFYWHFPDRATLVQALLDRWAYERTDELLALQLGGAGTRGPERGADGPSTEPGITGSGTPGQSGPEPGRHAGTSPAARLRRMHELGREVGPIDRAMRLWAQNDPKVAEAVRHADESLIGHLTDTLVELGFAPEDAELRAVMMLRATVGGYFVTPTARSGPDRYERALGLFLERRATTDHP